MSKHSKSSCSSQLSPPPVFGWRLPPAVKCKRTWGQHERTSAQRTAGRLGAAQAVRQPPEAGCAAGRRAVRCRELIQRLSPQVSAGQRLQHGALPQGKSRHWESGETCWSLGESRRAHRNHTVRKTFGRADHHHHSPTLSWAVQSWAGLVGRLTVVSKIT